MPANATGWLLRLDPDDLRGAPIVSGGATAMQTISYLNPLTEYKYQGRAVNDTGTHAPSNWTRQATFTTTRAKLKTLGFSLEAHVGFVRCRRGDFTRGGDKMLLKRAGSAEALASADERDFGSLAYIDLRGPANVPIHVEVRQGSTRNGWDDSDAITDSATPLSSGDLAATLRTVPELVRGKVGEELRVIMLAEATGGSESYATYLFEYKNEAGAWTQIHTGSEKTRALERGQHRTGLRQCQHRRRPRFHANQSHRDRLGRREGDSANASEVRAKRDQRACGETWSTRSGRPSTCDWQPTPHRSSAASTTCWTWC